MSMAQLGAGNTRRVQTVKEMDHFLYHQVLEPWESLADSVFRKMLDEAIWRHGLVAAPSRY